MIRTLAFVAALDVLAAATIYALAELLAHSWNPFL
jgi:hypothetical protein